MVDLFVPVVVGGKAVMAIATPTTADAYVTRDDYESLQAQLADAQRKYEIAVDMCNVEHEAANKAESQLDAERERADRLQRVVDAAREQQPVAVVIDGIEYLGHGIAQRFLTLVNTFPAGTEFYEAAPVPAQPAVPDDVAKDAARLALVWRVATGRETDEERATLGDVSPNAEYDEFIAGIDAAIISTTEGRKDAN